MSLFFFFLLQDTRLCFYSMALPRSMSLSTKMTSTNIAKSPSPFSTYLKTQTEQKTSPACVVDSRHELFAFSSLSSCSALSATRVPAMPAGSPA